MTYEVLENFRVAGFVLPAGTSVKHVDFAFCNLALRMGPDDGHPMTEALHYATENGKGRVAGPTIATSEHQGRVVRVIGGTAPTPRQHAWFLGPQISDLTGVGVKKALEDLLAAAGALEIAQCDLQQTFKSGVSVETARAMACLVQSNEKTAELALQWALNATADAFRLIISTVAPQWDRAARFADGALALLRAVDVNYCGSAGHLADRAANVEANACAVALLSARRLNRTPSNLVGRASLSARELAAARIAELEAVLAGWRF